MTDTGPLTGSREARRLFVDELRWRRIVEKAVDAFKQGLRTPPSEPTEK